MITVLERAASSGRPARHGGVEDRTNSAKRRLEKIAIEGGHGRIEWERPAPSAAFSRRDALTPGFNEAVGVARDLGFAPFIRPVGGRLAAYHEGSLVLDVLTRNEDPRPGTTARFRAIAETLTVGLRRLGVDARVGGLPGEYCPGDWSVNAGGTRKLVGTGQRLVRDAVLVTAVIVVGHPEPLRRVLTDAYECLGLDLDPVTVGAITDDVPGVTLDEVQEALTEELGRALALDGPDIVGGARLLEPWDPR